MGRTNLARKDVLPDLGDDPVWQAFLRAPVDPNPTPEVESWALLDPASQMFVDADFVAHDLERRAQAEKARPRKR